MIIGRLGGVSPDGLTAVVDAQTQEMHSLPLPKVKAGMEILQDTAGDWHVVIRPEDEKDPERRPEETDSLYEERVNQHKEDLNALREADAFYYATRDFLSFRDYLYITEKFPKDCFQKYKRNPFYLADLCRGEEDAPICEIPVIDKKVILSTFEDRRNEMKYVMRHVCQCNEAAGHTWMYLSDFERRVKSLLIRDGHPLLTGSVAPYLRYYQKEFVIKGSGPEAKVGLSSSYYREEAIYRQVALALSIPSPFPKFEALKQEGNESPMQVQVAQSVVTMGGRLCILTGGPGTGKTTTLKLIVKNLCRQYPGVNIHLLSPTGMAARRIREVFGDTEVKVSTVHKFVGFGMQHLTGGVLRTIDAAGLIIVDESSMLDLDIFQRLVSMINFKKTKLILVGDVDQLPSIGAGNVLCDLIRMGVHTQYLEENFRSNGSVIQNSRKINSGDPCLLEDEHFKIRAYPSSLSDYFSGMNAQADIVITPYRKETVSCKEKDTGEKRKGATNRVNLVAQARIFEEVDGLKGLNFGKKAHFRTGDLVIMMRTNYKAGYCNGEPGKIITHLPNGDWLVGFGEGRTALVSRPEDMDLGYAGTVHKSQGSEYDTVIVDIPEYSDFVTRRMLYTAVTRAKSNVIIHSTKEILRKVILNNPEESRNTWLGVFDKLLNLYS